MSLLSIDIFTGLLTVVLVLRLASKLTRLIMFE